ncbi:MAG: sulfatase-like hydrolase/transferase [Deltaproteobacteria bacterium]|nr:sulfatase-like hydrolase/transferase [Deltaproteobacteria bacterium]
MAAMWRESSRRDASDASGGEARPPRARLLRWAGWCAVANILLLIAVSLRNLAVTDLPDGDLPRLFAGLMFVGHGAFLTCFPLIALAFLIVVWPRRRVVLIAGPVLFALLIGTALVDTVVYQQYRFHLNAEIFNLLFGGAAGEILVFSATMYLQAILIAIALLAAELVGGRLVWRWVGGRAGGWPGRALATVLVASFLLQGLVHAWADVAGYTPVTRQGRTLLGYVPVTAEQLFKKLGVEIDRADAALLARDRGSTLAYPLHPLSCEDTNAPPNLLWVVIDGWRFDALNAATTPHVAALAERSLRFDDHLSGGSATRTGIFSLFYGIPGTYWHAMLAEQRGPVLISELRRQGYEIEIFASAKLVNPEFDRTVFAEVDELRLRSDGKRASERDVDLTEDFLAFLDRRAVDRPFFSMLFYDAPHAYDLPDGFPQPFQPSWDEVNYLALGPDFDPLPFHNRYLNCVRFNDALVGRVLDALEREGLMEETVIVITSDHGQEFNENGLNYWGHDSNFSRYQVAVPLVIHWPGREPRRYAHRTSHFDLAPTLLDELFGCANDYADHSVGRHLLEPGGRDQLLLANYVDYAVVQPDRIVAVYPYGVELLDPRYRPLPGAELDKAVMLTALEQRGRFYR